MSKNNPKATLYKYVNTSFLEETIDNGYLYLSDGNNFNDPFELRQIDRETEETNFIEGLHILCLTNSFRNKLMWSHYADSHKGVCLTVEIPSLHIYPVCDTGRRIYSDNNIDDIINNAKKGNKRNLRKDYSILSREKKIALIKDQNWNYEKEYRMVFDHNDEQRLIKKECDNGEIKWFLPVKIKNIYLGVNFDLDSNRGVIEQCREKGISIKRMVLSNQNYALVVRELES